MHIRLSIAIIRKKCKAVAKQRAQMNLQDQCAHHCVGTVVGLHLLFVRQDLRRIHPPG